MRECFYSHHLPSYHRVTEKERFEPNKKEMMKRKITKKLSKKRREKKTGFKQ